MNIVAILIIIIGILSLIMFVNCIGLFHRRSLIFMQLIKLNSWYLCRKLTKLERIGRFFKIIAGLVFLPFFKTELFFKIFFKNIMNSTYHNIYYDQLGSMKFIKILKYIQQYINSDITEIQFESDIESILDRFNMSVFRYNGVELSFNTFNQAHLDNISLNRFNGLNNDSDYYRYLEVIVYNKSLKVFRVIHIVKDRVKTIISINNHEIERYYYSLGTSSILDNILLEKFQGYRISQLRCENIHKSKYRELISLFGKYDSYNVEIIYADE